MKKISIVLIITLFSFRFLSAQLIETKLDIVGGIAAREFFHAGLRYQYTPITQFGVFYGGDIGFRNRPVQTWTFDNMIHFGGLSYNTNRQAWYARQGITLSQHRYSDHVFKYTYVNVGAGREFGINDWLGINLDMGLIMQLREKKDYTDPAIPDKYINAWFFYPSVRAQVFYSF